MDLGVNVQVEVIEKAATRALPNWAQLKRSVQMFCVLLDRFHRLFQFFDKIGIADNEEKYIRVLDVPHAPAECWALFRRRNPRIPLLGALLGDAHRRLPPAVSR